MGRTGAVAAKGSSAPPRIIVDIIAILEQQRAMLSLIDGPGYLYASGAPLFRYAHAIF